VEVGSGPGFLKEIAPDLIATDVVYSPWLDAVVDAQRMPFKPASVMNLVGLDVLHHLEAPLDLLREASRVLLPGGRCILVEPWITPLSYIIYRYFHQENCDISARPLHGQALCCATRKTPLAGNICTPYLMFGPAGRHQTLQAPRTMRLLRVEPFCLFAYLLSFGFKAINLLPEVLYPVVARLEQTTLPLWRSLAALRVLLILEKPV